LACGVLAALTQWFFSQNSGIPSLGASGAIGLWVPILRFPLSSGFDLSFLGIFHHHSTNPAIFFLGFCSQQALYGVARNAPSNIGMESGGIAYWAHAGGFVFGAILGPLLGLFGPE